MNNIILSKESSNEELKTYFNAVLELSQSNNEFPVNLDDVWMLVYGRKQEAVRALTSNEQFMEGIDYQSVRKDAQQDSEKLWGGNNKVDYKLSVSCLEFFIARKVRPVFEVYRQVFHKAINNAALPRTFAEALRLAAEQAEQLEQQQKQLELKDTIILEYEPKANYYDIILSSNNAINITVIAKDYGMSAKAMNKKLNEIGIIFKSGDTWLPYQEYAAMGYTKTETVSYNDGKGATVHSKWTQKGRLFLYDLLKRHGILPLIEQ